MDDYEDVRDLERRGISYAQAMADAEKAGRWTTSISVAEAVKRVSLAYREALRKK